MGLSYRVDNLKNQSPLLKTITMKDKRIKQLEKGIIDLQKQLEHIKSEALDENKGESEIEPNKWYTGRGGFNWLVYIDRVDTINVYGYGICTDDNEWEDSFNGGLSMRWKPATDKEVEEALIKEAKRRGFKEGVKFTGKPLGDMWYGSHEAGSKSVFEFKLNELLFDGFSIMNNGLWSTIIEEPKVTINGEIMKQEGDIISFGCAKFNRVQLLKMRERIGVFNANYVDNEAKQNRKIKSITLDSDVTITVEELKLIVDNIK